MRTRRDRKRRGPYQILFSGGNEVRIASRYLDRQPGALRKAALQVQLQRDTDGVEAGPEIGAGCRYPKGGQYVIVRDSAKIVPGIPSPSRLVLPLHVSLDIRSIEINFT